MVLLAGSGVMNASPGLGGHVYKGFKKSQFGNYHVFVLHRKFLFFFFPQTEQNKILKASKLLEV